MEQPDAVILDLDPGLAFGTGTHPTTALCLEWLDGHSVTGKSVIDFGCGSGILAIAALKLGAAHAVAIDHAGRKPAFRFRPSDPTTVPRRDAAGDVRPGLLLGC